MGASQSEGLGAQHVPLAFSSPWQQERHPVSDAKNHLHLTPLLCWLNFFRGSIVFAVRTFSSSIDALDSFRALLLPFPTGQRNAQCAAGKSCSFDPGGLTQLVGNGRRREVFGHFDLFEQDSLLLVIGERLH